MKLLQKLYELQERDGYLSPEQLLALSRRERIPLYHLQGLVSFYPHFRTTLPPKTQVSVCRDLSCWLAGGPDTLGRLRDELANNTEVEIHEASCLGRCEMAPAACVNGRAVTVKEIDPTNLVAGDGEEVARNRERRQCDPYVSNEDRFGILRELLPIGREGAAQRVIAALIESGLRGMGGAGFPTGTKWGLVRVQARTPKYVICNADESEPGTFKDRVILAELPHLVIESLILAGFVTGAEKGILYIRHEYEPERHAFAAAMEDARRRQLLGSGILGTDFNFDLEIFVSPGGYILGEETALLEALEDKRGEPRNKPPFPGTHGLFGQPTLINNVETLAMIPGILQHGPQWWHSQGKPGFAGLKFVALSGHVEKPGVYEVSMGTTVRELIELGGGIKDGRKLKAFAPGGASSNFMPASQVDVPLDFEALAKSGSMLGSGAVVVVAEGTDMLALATNVVRFFRNESCGKCVPCRMGSQQAVEILERVQAGQGARTEIAVLADLGETMVQTSICGLGQVALNPILSVMKHWPEEVLHKKQFPSPRAAARAEFAMAKQYDATLKHLLETYPADWLEQMAKLFHLHAIGPVEVIDTDVSTITAAADKVFLVRSTIPWLMHLELQSSRDALLPHRVLKYNALLVERHQLPVRTIVVLLRPAADGPELNGQFRISLPGESHYLELRYDILRVWQYSPETFLTGGLGMLPLVPLSDIVPDALPEIIHRMDERLSKEVSPSVRRDLFSATYFLMGLRFPSEIAAQLIGGMISMKESTTYQAVVEEGRNEGRIEATRQSLLLMARKRFGAPDAISKNIVDGLGDRRQLEAILERVLDVNSWEELLSAHRGNAN